MESDETPKTNDAASRGRRVKLAALAVLTAICAIIAIVLTLPSDTAPPEATESVRVYIGDIGPTLEGDPFNVTVNIEDVKFLSYAAFDISFDDVRISYASTAAGNVGGTTPSVTAMTIEPGLLRIIADFSDYAFSGEGDGVSGSGQLCSIQFSATSAGTSPLDFAAGRGTPAGELTLVEWKAFEQDMIADVSWANGSVSID